MWFKKRMTGSDWRLLVSFKDFICKLRVSMFVSVWIDAHACRREVVSRGHPIR